MSNLVERLRDIEFALGEHPWASAINDTQAEIARLTAEVEQMQHDVLAYRLALGYEIPGDHDGLLSDGSLPLNGIAQAAWNQYDRRSSEWASGQAVVDAAREAVEEWQEFNDIEAEMTVLFEKLRALDGNHE